MYISRIQSRANLFHFFFFSINLLVFQLIIIMIKKFFSVMLFILLCHRKNSIIRRAVIRQTPANTRPFSNLVASIYFFASKHRLSIFCF